MQPPPRKMRWSWKVAEVAGIGIHVHATFLLILVWVALLRWQQEPTAGSVVRGLLAILALFGCVVLHELGHAFAARRFGIRTRDIILLPIGGVARLERMPEDPRQELVVAFAGPAVNLAITVLLFLTVEILGPGVSWHAILDMEASFLAWLMVANAFLAGFNLLPAFPMDGGRALRAILHLRMDYVRATQLAAAVGQVLAILFGVVGLMGNPLLLLIAFFIFLSASQEGAMAQIRAAFQGIPVGHVMVTEYRTLAPEDRLSQAMEHLLSGYQQDFPVVDGENLVGMLTRKDLLRKLAEAGAEARVAAAMQRECGSAADTEMLQGVFERMQVAGIPALPVTRSGRLVGLLTQENVGEFVMIQSAMDTAARRRAARTSPGEPRGGI